jgi:hypothetical protein
MLTVSVCYSNRSGQEFASCTLGGVELDSALLDQPVVFTAAVKRAYDRCVDAVNAQLGTTAPAAADAPAVNPAQARVNQPTPAPANPTLPASTLVAPPVAQLPPGKKTYYDNDSPPTTGATLGGFAKRKGCLPWFEAFAAANNLPKLCSSWSDQWAQYGFSQWQAAHVPPVVANGNGVAH